MVASGVPIPNGNHHVEEIAKMALDLLSKEWTETLRTVCTSQYFISIDVM
jgi:hypothetical protein